MTLYILFGFSIAFNLFAVLQLFSADKIMKKQQDLIRNILSKVEIHTEQMKKTAPAK